MSDPEARCRGCDHERSSHDVAGPGSDPIEFCGAPECPCDWFRFPDEGCAHEAELAILRAEKEKLNCELNELFREAQAAFGELDARDGSHWAHEGYDSLDRWRAFHAMLAEASPTETTKEAGP